MRAHLPSAAKDLQFGVRSCLYFVIILSNGAIEGTRTPTPLPVHGPEPCASANSATMAILDCNAAAAARPPSQRVWKTNTSIFTAPSPPVKHWRQRSCISGSDRELSVLREFLSVLCVLRSLMRPSITADTKILNPPYPSFAVIEILAFNTFDTGHPFSAASAYF
jgi:hypothetical protein